MQMNDVNLLRLDRNLSRDLLALHVLGDNAIPTGVADVKTKQNKTKQKQNKRVDLHRLGRYFSGDFLAVDELGDDFVALVGVSNSTV
jgi:hypothetical protein